MTEPTINTPTWPAHDQATRRWLPGGGTGSIPTPSAPSRRGPGEWDRFTQSTTASGEHNVRASRLAPSASPRPSSTGIPIPSRLPRPAARGHRCRRPPAARSVHGLRRDARRPPQPVVVERVQEALTNVGTLFVTPSPTATEIAERFQQRFGLDMLRFTNSGTESLMYAVRAARAFTGRKAIVKIEGRLSRRI